MRQSIYEFYDATGVLVASGNRNEVCGQLNCCTENLSYVINSGAYRVIRHKMENLYRLEDMDGSSIFCSKRKIRNVIGTGVPLTHVARDCARNLNYRYRNRWRIYLTDEWEETGDPELMAEPDGDQHRYANYPPCDEVECQANREGRCSCLSDNDFGGRHCPFFRKRNFENMKVFSGGKAE